MNSGINLFETFTINYKDADLFYAFKAWIVERTGVIWAHHHVSDTEIRGFQVIPIVANLPDSALLCDRS